MGRETIAPLGAGIRPSWKTRFERRSPDYPTDWREIPVVKE